MLQKLDLRWREFRDRATSRLTRKRGVEYINAILASAGRQQITQRDYDGFLQELRDDAPLRDQFESKKVLFQGLHPTKYKESWETRVNRTRALNDTFYVLIRVLRPEYIIETGVALGTTTSLILAALHRSGFGTLTSIDLPAHGQMADFPINEVGQLIPEVYKDRWTLILEDSLTALPREFSGRVPDIFFHDSDHTYKHMAFEYGLALSYLKPRSVMISDDTRISHAFADMMHECGLPYLKHADNYSIGVAVIQ